MAQIHHVDSPSLVAESVVRGGGSPDWPDAVGPCLDMQMLRRGGSESSHTCSCSPPGRGAPCGQQIAAGHMDPCKLVVWAGPSSLVSPPRPAYSAQSKGKEEREGKRRVRACFLCLDAVAALMAGAPQMAAVMPDGPPAHRLAAPAPPWVTTGLPRPAANAAFSNTPPDASVTSSTVRGSPPPAADPAPARSSAASSSAPVRSSTAPDGSGAGVSQPRQAPVCIASTRAA